MYWLLFNQHCQHRTNQKLRSWANAVFQNRGVCGKEFPSLPPPPPPHLTRHSFSFSFFFWLSTQLSRRTRAEALAAQATVQRTCFDLSFMECLTLVIMSLTLTKQYKNHFHFFNYSLFRLHEKSAVQLAVLKAVPNWNYYYYYYFMTGIDYSSVIWIPSNSSLAS